MKPRKPQRPQKRSSKQGPQQGPARGSGPERGLARRRAPERLVQIEKPIYGGAFLARDEGKAVFVPLALPGEQARVRMVEEKRGYASAELEEVVASAPERVAPGCRHFGPCGGCQYQHADYPAQLRFKQAVLRETLERGGVTAPGEIAVLSGEPWGYRNRIRLALDAEGHVGYRGRRSHALVRIAECPIAAPLLVRSALSIAERLRAMAPAARPKELGLFCDAEEKALLATLFTASAKKAGFDDLAHALQQDIPELKGVELVAEGAANQPARTVARWGAASLHYRAAGFDYRVDHGAFFQVNRWLTDALLERVTAGQAGLLAWDLFAGVGLFARRLTAGFERVVAVESAPAAAEGLRANLSGTSGDAVQASTLDFLRRHEGSSHRSTVPDLVVVDPPRTGLGAEITGLLAAIAPPRMVYVSCDPATLARDLRALLGAGYALEKIALVDLFPQTFHLETVVHLTAVRS